MTIPPLAPEDHACETCALSYAELTTADALALIHAVPRDIAELLAVPDVRWHARHGAWSALEYACHLRDVYATYTIRLYRCRTENEPTLEPMLNDLRAARFRYNDLDPRSIVDELRANVAGFADETARVRDWSRTVTRLPGEHRTALWLLRQAAHEGIHHTADIRTILSGDDRRGGPVDSGGHEA